MILDDLIKDIGSGEKTTTQILMATKVLLADLEQPELIAWVNRELGGYADEDQLPPYRLVPAVVKGNIVSPGWMGNHQQLALGHLTEEQRENLEVTKVREGLPTLETLSQQASKDGVLQRPIPMEFNGALAKGLRQEWKVNAAWCEVSVAYLKNVEAQVRSRLLDFLLVLRATVGRDVADRDLKAKSSGIDLPSAFNGAVFGDNTVINIGDHNQLKVSNEKRSAEIDLFEKLKAAGLGEADIEDLKAAIARDKENGGLPSLTKETGKWYEGLLGKAKHGVVAISEGVVAHTIAGLLLSYIHVVGTAAH